MNHLLDWHLLDDTVWNGCLDRALEWISAAARSRNVSGAKLEGGVGSAVTPMGPAMGSAARTVTPADSAAGSVAQTVTPAIPFGRKLGLVFFNDSLRTRVSMELAAHELGAYPIVVVPGQGTWGFAWDKCPMDGAEAEHIREAIGVLSRYTDALGVRLFASGTDLHADRSEVRMHAIMTAATVPVINLESAFFHPCQALADAATLRGQFGGNLTGRKFVLTWCTHPKALPMAVPNSALLAATRLGMDVTVLRPDGFDLDGTVIAMARHQAETSGGTIQVSDDREAGFDGADVIYAKAWGGIGRYDNSAREAEARSAHGDWRVTPEWMARTRDARLMHCLPVRRGVVVDDAILDSPSAIHLEQAENRLHAQKAILEWVLADRFAADEPAGGESA